MARIVEHEVFTVVVEETKRIEARVDADTLIKEFADEWAEFMRGDEPTNDDKYEFVRQTLDEMSATDFFFPGSSPWVVSHREDFDTDIQVRSMILAPGIHPAIPSDTYHSDALTEQPSLSASIAVELVTKSPAHAKAAHPRLNPYLVREDKAHFDLGNCVHSVLLEGVDKVEVIEADSWRTNAAKEARDVARANNKIPLLGKDYFDMLAMLDAAKKQIAEYDASPPLLSDGVPEPTLTWEEDGVFFRSRLDWLRTDFAAIDDIKTSAHGADPDRFSRKTIYSYGYDMRCAMYLRGVKAVTGVDAEFRWIVIETTPPYVVTVVSPKADVLAHGQSKVEQAIRLWRRCLAEDRWPGYTDRVCYAELPAWEDTRWLEKAEREGFDA